MGFREWLYLSEGPDGGHIKVPLPSVKQNHTYDCGAAVLRSICEFFKVGPEAQDEFIKACKTGEDHGTKPTDLIRAAASFGLLTRAQHDMDISDLRDFLDAGRPVICCIQAYGKDDGDYDDRMSGHYVVAIGYDKSKVYFEDPSMEGSRGFLHYREFMKRWRDQDGEGHVYDRFGIAIWKPSGGVPPDDQPKKHRVIP